MIDKVPLLRRVEDNGTHISGASQTAVLLIQLLPPKLDKDLEQFSSFIIKPAIDGNFDVLLLLAHWVLNFFEDCTLDSTFEMVK